MYRSKSENCWSCRLDLLRKIERNVLSANTLEDRTRNAVAISMGIAMVFFTAVMLFFCDCEFYSKIYSEIFVMTVLVVFSILKIIKNKTDRKKKIIKLFSGYNPISLYDYENLKRKFDFLRWDFCDVNDWLEKERNAIYIAADWPLGKSD